MLYLFLSPQANNKIYPRSDISKKENLWRVEKTCVADAAMEKKVQIY